MLNVGIDMERMRNVNSGLGQFCLQLTQELQKTKEINCHLFYPHQYSLPKNETAYNISKLAKITGLQAPQIDVFHATHQDSKLRVKSKPNVLTIHDLNFLEKYTTRSPRGFYRYHQFQYLIQQRIKRSRAVNFISNYSFNIAQQYFNFDSVKTQVIHNGFCLSAKEAIKPSVSPTQFLFTIGIINAKKNFHTLLPIVKATGLPLILAGNNTNVYVQEIKKYAQELGISSLVHFVGLITEEEKLWYYQNCYAFLFPSLAEGFGMPAIEAMSQGKPTFLSKKTSLPEVGGPHAYFFDSFEPQEMIQTFEKGITHYTHNPQQRELIIQHASQFSWEKAAKEYIALYKSAV